MTRAELEAEIWKRFKRARAADVDAILAAADRYATTEATDALRTADELGAS